MNTCIRGHNHLLDELKTAPEYRQLSIIDRFDEIVDDAAELKRTVDALTGAENGSIAIGVGHRGQRPLMTEEGAG